MAKVTNKAKKAKATTKKAAEVKVQGVTPNRKVAMQQRPNRTTTAKSTKASRKWIFRGVTKADLRSNVIQETDVQSSTPFTKDQAQAIIAKALSQSDIVAARMFYKKPSDEGVAMRGVYVAYAEENGVKPSDMVSASA